MPCYRSCFFDFNVFENYAIFCLQVDKRDYKRNTKFMHQVSQKIGYSDAVTQMINANLIIFSWLRHKDKTGSAIEPFWSSIRAASLMNRNLVWSCDVFCVVLLCGTQRLLAYSFVTVDLDLLSLFCCSWSLYATLFPRSPPAPTNVRPVSRDSLCAMVPLSIPPNVPPLQNGLGLKPRTTSSIYRYALGALYPIAHRPYSNTLHNDEDKTEPLVQVWKLDFALLIIGIFSRFSHQVSLAGDNKGTFRSLSQFATCLPHTVKASHCPFMLNVKQRIVNTNFYGL